MFKRWGRTGLWWAAAVACLGCASTPAAGAPVGGTPGENEKRAMCPVVTIGELRTRMASALNEQSWSVVPSPVLPLDWPPRTQGVEAIAYRVEALPTGNVAYAIHTSHVITVAPWIGEPHVERVFPEKLGREFEDAGLPSGAAQDQAEQALLDVIAHCRSAESARKTLQPYLDWVRHYPVRGRHLVARRPEFFAWLRGEAPAAPSQKP